MKNATWCELEGLKRLVSFMESKDLDVEALIKDRHRQCGKWIREQMPQTKHYFDVWHVAKGNCIGLPVDMSYVLKLIVQVQHMDILVLF